jgi:putative transposase
MVTVRALDELRLGDLWAEVPPGEDEFWWDSQEKQRVLLKHLLEGALEEEMTQLIAAGRYRRTELRRGYRNGFYSRDLVTQYGILSGVRVPRARDGHASFALFARYQRYQARVEALIRDVFLAGVSTRRVGAVLEPLLGERPSAQTVSRIAQQLDHQVAGFHGRPLRDEIQYLFLDGVGMRVKGAVGAKRRLVLCAYGIGTDGIRRLIDFRPAASESVAAWEGFLRQLHERGLTGHQLRLVITDGCPGLHTALATVYPYVPRQRCWAHKLRNVANLLKRDQQQPCLSAARQIYLAPTRREAIRACWLWARAWRSRAPKAVDCLKRDLEELLPFLTMPEDHRVVVRTTNAIERCFVEVRRRTRPMTCFTNDASCERMMYAVFAHLNKDWQRAPLSAFTHNS